MLVKVKIIEILAQNQIIVEEIISTMPSLAEIV